MKVLKKVIIIISILLLVLFSILFFIGYGYYSNVMKEKPLVDRINEVTSKEHFVKFDDLNKNYINAVIAVEDHRYFDHGAVDYLSIIRAIFTNLKEGEFEQGGSTITQQVAKNVIFTQERTLARKLGEIFAASDLEKNYSKNEIFAIYVNTAYFGNGYYGIYDACKGYYNKEPKDLTLYEASMLAGVPNAPSLYAPTVNPELAKQRQKIVLNAMVKYGYISESDKSDVLNEASTPQSTTNTTSQFQTDTTTSTIESVKEE